MCKKRILVIDDEEGFMQMVKLNLEESGKYEVKTENKGSNAISTALDFKPDLILLDIIMPDMDGTEVACKVKKEQGLKDVPIIFITAAATKKDVYEKNGKIGGCSFIAKPVSADELIYRIEKLIKQ